MRTAIFLSSIMLLGMFSSPVLGQQVTGIDHPGIKWDWKVKAENYTFDVITVSNYEMKNVTFDKMNKELIFAGNSTHDGNIAEIEIPHNLIGGNLTTTINGKTTSPIIITGVNSSTMVLKFNQTGPTRTSVIGTTYLPEFSSAASIVMVLSIMIVLFTLKLRKI